MSDPFDEMLERIAAKQAVILEEEIVKAQARANEIGAGLRVERYYNTSVIVITKAVPAGTVERVRYNEYYGPKEQQ